MFDNFLYHGPPDCLYRGPPSPRLVFINLSTERISVLLMPLFYFFLHFVSRSLYETSLFGFNVMEALRSYFCSALKRHEHNCPKFQTFTSRKNIGPPPRGGRGGFDITPRYDGYQSEHPFPRGGPPPRFY